MQVLGIDAGHKQCLLRYAGLLLRVSQPNQALQLAQRAVAAHPGDPAAAKLHADALR